MEATRKTTDPQAAQVVCVCFFLALAILAVFGQTAHFGFVNFDDDIYVYANPDVTGGLRWEGVVRAFTHVECSLYHPLTMISLMADAQMHGLDAGGFHLCNVLIHTASAILLFLILRWMTGALWRSAFVAAVFAIHPLRVESVAWVTERKDVLGAFFFILTVGAYARYVRKPDSPGRYLMVAGLFVLDLLCKPIAVTLPLALLLLDYWPLNRFTPATPNPDCDTDGRGKGRAGSPLPAAARTECAPYQLRPAYYPNRPLGIARRLILEKIPLLALAAAACAVTFFAAGKAVVSAASVPLPMRLGNALVSCAVYLRQMVWPVGLAVFYPYPAKSTPLWELALAFLLLAIITGMVLALGRKRPWLWVGWFWYLGMLAPVIGLVQVGLFAHADRNTYLSQIGLYVLLTWAVAGMSAGWPYRRWILGGASAAILVALILCAHTQASYWRNSESLWNRAISCTSGNYLAQYNLGTALLPQGRLAEAIGHFQKAVEIRPDYAEARDNLAKAHYNLANALLKQGKPEEAIAHFQQSLEIEPANAKALNNLGNALAAKGAYQDARAPYEKALQIQPGFADAHYDLGQVLLKLGRFDESVAQFRKALDIEPKNTEAQNGVGEALLLKGDLEGALACFGKNTALNPDPLTRWRSLGGGFLEKGEWDAAIVCYRQAINIVPRSADACADLGMAYLKKGETREAMDSWQQALAINPGQISVLNNLAWLLATATDPSLRDGAKAVALATQASQSSGGGNPVILHTLAVAYAAEGNYRQAATTARRALDLASAQKKDALAATLQQEIQQYESNPPPGNAPP
jgi:tetratricopeptide (TPR) repeat protein